MKNDFCYSCGNHGCGLCDPKNHPIAWLYRGSDKELPSVALDHKLDDEQKKNCIPLTPQRTWEKPWVSLTDDEIEACNQTITDVGSPCVWLAGDDFEEGGLQFARAIEAKLKEKNT